MKEIKHDEIGRIDKAIKEKTTKELQEECSDSDIIIYKTIRSGRNDCTYTPILKVEK